MSVKFLVAEDEAAVARMIRRVLGQHGFVEIVETAAEARDRLASREYDALVADVGLPDGSGLELVAQAVAERKLQALLMSGRVDPERLAEAHELGVHFLLKPIRSSQLDLFAARVRQAQRPDGQRGRIDRAVDEWRGRYGLSVAQEDLLRLSAHGVKRQDIAQERDVAPSTIKKQVHEMLARTGDGSLDAAVARLLREALGDTR